MAPAIWKSKEAFKETENVQCFETTHTEYKRFRNVKEPPSSKR